MTSKFLILISFALCQQLAAQRYDIAGGVKVADGIGLSGAFRFADKYTAELILKPNLFSDYSMASVGVKRHWGILGSKRLNVFGGAGIFTRNQESGFKEIGKVQAGGLVFTGGAEMTVGRINMSIDFTPMLTVNQDDRNKNYYSYSGVSARYVFDKRESKTKKWTDKIRDKFKKKPKK